MSYFRLESSGLIGVGRGLNFNSTSDQAITMLVDKYIVTNIFAVNASVSLTLAVGGVYNATSKPAGGIVVAATQVYSALTGATKYVALTLASLAITDVQTATSLYLSLTVAQGSTATADLLFFGFKVP